MSVLKKAAEKFHINVIHIYMPLAPFFSSTPWVCMLSDAYVLCLHRTYRIASFGLAPRGRTWKFFCGVCLVFWQEPAAVMPLSYPFQVLSAPLQSRHITTGNSWTPPTWEIPSQAKSCSPSRGSRCPLEVSGRQHPVYVNSLALPVTSLVINVLCRVGKEFLCCIKNCDSIFRWPAQFQHVIVIVTGP